MVREKFAVIIGPTASGKTRLAVNLASAIDGEIISADSRQIYRGMDIGTGKDLDEYGNVPYHLIDIAPAGSKYNLYQYLSEYRKAFVDIRRRGCNPVVCGGTGMYVEAALNNLQLPEVPENKQLRESLEGKSLDELTKILSTMKSLHNTTDVDTVKRAVRAIEIETYYLEHPEKAANTRPQPDQSAVIIGVDIPRDIRRERISKRLDTRLQEGLVDEVKTLVKSGVKPDDLIYYGLEYKFVTQYVVGQITYEQMHDSLETAIHQFAKRQMTWFRGMERRGFKINWIDWDMPCDQSVGYIISLLK